jgi:hypothetical protein
VRPQAPATEAVVGTYVTLSFSGEIISLVKMSCPHILYINICERTHIYQAFTHSEYLIRQQETLSCFCIGFYWWSYILPIKKGTVTDFWLNT